MGIKRTYTKVQSFPSPDSAISSPPPTQSDQSSAPQLDNLLQHHAPRISADRLFKILDASIASQKNGMQLAMGTICPAIGTNSDCKFINCYLDSSLLLLEACHSIQLRLASIRTSLDSIPIALHLLEAEQAPSKAVLQQAAIALESSRFKNKRHHSAMEKSLSRMKTFGRRLSSAASVNEAISPDLYKALSDSWAMAALAVGVLGSATCISSLTCSSVQPLQAEPRTILVNESGNKLKVFRKKLYKTVSMEELASADLASQTLLKLVSAWKKGGSSNLRRMAVKAVAGEVRRRQEVLEKVLPQLEDKIEEFCQQIAAMRIGMFGLLREEQGLEMAQLSSSEESRMQINRAEYEKGVGQIKVKAKVSMQSWPSVGIRFVA